MRYFTWKLELVLNNLWVIVERWGLSFVTRDALTDRKCIPNIIEDINSKVITGAI